MASNNLDNIKGVIPALLTPFNENGSLDEKALRVLVDFLIDKGVSGFYLNGSTGEGFLMLMEERMRMLEIVMDQVNGRLPVINQIGCLQMEAVLNLARHSMHIGAAAVSSVPPFYYNFSLREIKEYYNLIIENCNLPLIVYSIPATTGVNMSYDFIEELARNKGIAGIKYTTYNHYDMAKIKEINNNRFIVFSGADEMCLSGLMAGSNALIGSFYNMIPELYIRLVKHFNNNEMEEARKLYIAGNDIIRLYLRYPLYSALKASLSWRGLSGGCCKKPFRRLDDLEMKTIREELLNIEEKRNTGLDFFKEIVQG